MTAGGGLECGDWRSGVVNGEVKLNGFCVPNEGLFLSYSLLLLNDSIFVSHCVMIATAKRTTA